METWLPHEIPWANPWVQLWGEAIPGAEALRILGFWFGIPQNHPFSWVSIHPKPYMALGVAVQADVDTQYGTCIAFVGTGVVRDLSSVYFCTSWSRALEKGSSSDMSRPRLPVHWLFYWRNQHLELGEPWIIMGSWDADKVSAKINAWSVVVRWNLRGFNEWPQLVGHNCLILLPKDDSLLSCPCVHCFLKRISAQWAYFWVAFSGSFGYDESKRGKWFLWLANAVSFRAALSLRRNPGLEMCSECSPNVRQFTTKYRYLQVSSSTQTWLAGKGIIYRC